MTTLGFYSRQRAEEIDALITEIEQMKAAGLFEQAAQAAEKIEPVIVRLREDAPAGDMSQHVAVVLTLEETVTEVEGGDSVTSTAIIESDIEYWVRNVSAVDLFTDDTALATYSELYGFLVTSGSGTTGTSIETSLTECCAEGEADSTADCVHVPTTNSRLGLDKDLLLVNPDTGLSEITFDYRSHKLINSDTDCVWVRTLTTDDNIVWKITLTVEAEISHIRITREGERMGEYRAMTGLFSPQYSTTFKLYSSRIDTLPCWLCVTPNRVRFVSDTCFLNDGTAVVPPYLDVTISGPTPPTITFGCCSSYLGSFRLYFAKFSRSASGEFCQVEYETDEKGIYWPPSFPPDTNNATCGDRLTALPKYRLFVRENGFVQLAPSAGGYTSPGTLANFFGPLDGNPSTGAEILAVLSSTFTLRPSTLYEEARCLPISNILDIATYPTAVFTAPTEDT